VASSQCLRGEIGTKPLLRHEMFCALPPIFSRENFLSGSVSGRDRRFRAQSRLGCDGKKTGNLEQFPNDSRHRIGSCSRFEIRADNRRFQVKSNFTPRKARRENRPPPRGCSLTFPSQPIVQLGLLRGVSSLKVFSKWAHGLSLSGVLRF
jgi:hypothetical protein